MRCQIDSRKFGRIFFDISDEDAGLLSSYGWYADKRGSNFYITANISKKENKPASKIYLHRLIMGFPDGIVDHKDGNTLNNCRDNLRIAGSIQSAANKSAYSNNQSGYKGVYFREHAGRFVTKIIVNRKQIHGGYFDTPEEAALKYNEMAEKYYGEFAKLNKIK